MTCASHDGNKAKRPSGRRGKCLSVEDVIVLAPLLLLHSVDGGRVLLLHKCPGRGTQLEP